MPTLWCSFELKNEVLLSSMLNQYAGVDLAQHPEKFDYYADRFEEIPVYLQTYFGSTEVEKVLAMIEYSIYAYDIGHIVIDNLQFMLSGQGTGFQRYELQDDVISQFRKLATNLNVHITLVIHPRKGEDGVDLSLNSVFGTAKSTQEADNVMILQYRHKYKVVDLKKNRFDGEIGKVSLWFDKGSKRFEQMGSKEIEALISGAEVEDVLSKRQKSQEETEEGLKVKQLNENNTANQNTGNRVEKKKLDQLINSYFEKAEEPARVSKGKRQRGIMLKIIGEDDSGNETISYNSPIRNSANSNSQEGLDSRTGLANDFDLNNLIEEEARMLSIRKESQNQQEILEKNLESQNKEQILEKNLDSQNKEEILQNLSHNVDLEAQAKIDHKIEPNMSNSDQVIVSGSNSENSGASSIKNQEDLTQTEDLIRGVEVPQNLGKKLSEVSTNNSKEDEAIESFKEEMFEPKITEEGLSNPASDLQSLADKYNQPSNTGNSKNEAQLGGFSSAKNIEKVSSFYEDGDTVLTYSDMLNDLLDSNTNRNKYKPNNQKMGGFHPQDPSEKELTDFDSREEGKVVNSSNSLDFSMNVYDEEDEEK